ncbi:MAG: glycine cleavage system protein GcvH [Chloroflexi bacterium]|nr:glycine cleavage system protein GcvH [Chloroflexota bacterium]
MQLIQVAVDKFVFRVARDYRYNDADVWGKHEGDRVRVGLTDFLQQKSGDIAFVNLKAIGTDIAANDELAALETIKVDLVIASPIAGRIVAVNDALIDHPELVNRDPYGAGWLVEVKPTNVTDYDALLDAESYLPQMKARAEMEREK